MKPFCPIEKIRGLKFTDFDDMMEDKLFGWVVRLYHPNKLFGIQDLVAIGDVASSKGVKINLKPENFDVDDELENLRVFIVNIPLTDFDGSFPVSSERDSSPRFQFDDEEEDEDDGGVFDSTKLSIADRRLLGFIRT